MTAFVRGEPPAFPLTGTCNVAMVKVLWKGLFCVSRSFLDGSREASSIGRIGERVEGAFVVVRIRKEEIERSQLVFELSCLEHFHIPAWIHGSSVGSLARASRKVACEVAFIFISTFCIPSPSFRFEPTHKDYWPTNRSLRLIRFKSSAMAESPNTSQNYWNASILLVSSTVTSWLHTMRMNIEQKQQSS